MRFQIVHDSLHRRDGWTETYRLQVDAAVAGFASVAIGGPWKGKPTLFEFYVLPVHQSRAFDLFEALLQTSGARLMEIQSNDTLLSVMLHAYARDIACEKIVFHDRLASTLSVDGAALQQMTPGEQIRQSIEARQGGGEWRLLVEGQSAATGGILFHYNVPYGDIYMDVAEPFRQRGFGSYLVQELKRIAYELGSIPCARCSPDNIASRKTLQKAGFVPFANILNGSIASRNS